ncbi:MAG: glycosyltransferase family 9 protein [Candidatus Aminicenantes bacterium]|nr:glycosyltransferase family 9 protein [Candidatus Aminicenantes bacterium]
MPFLLIRLGGLGDLLVTLPSLNLIRKSRPDAQLNLFCRETYGRFFEETEIVETIVPSSSAEFSPLFGPTPYPKDTQKWLDKFSAILGWMSKGKGFNYGRFITYDPNSGLPISRFFFDKTVEFLGGDGKKLYAFEDYCFFPRVPSGNTSGFRQNAEFSKAGKYAVLHPGSGSRKKCWPLSRFLEIAERLSRKGMKGMMVTGEAEEWLEPKFSRLPSGWRREHCPPLKRLAALLSRCLFYLGNDSGVTHLAASCRANVVALYLEKNLPAWRPYGRVKVLQGDSIEEIQTEDVWKAVGSL